MIIHDTITCQRTYLRRARRGRQVQTILALCGRAPACRSLGAGRCLFLQSIYLQSIYLSSYLRFLNIAFGSLRELHYQLNLSKRLGFLPNEDSSLIEPTVVETEKVLNGLICALRDVL